MSDENQMKPERQMAVRAMQNLGWTAKKIPGGSHPRWEFSRPDTGGLWDVVRVTQADICMRWVARQAVKYNDALGLYAEILAAEDRWLRERFAGIYAAPTTHPGAADE